MKESIDPLQKETLMHLIPIPAGMETGYFVMGENVLPELPELLRTAFPGRVIQFVADETRGAPPVRKRRNSCARQRSRCATR